MLAFDHGVCCAVKGERSSYVFCSLGAGATLEWGNWIFKYPFACLPPFALGSGRKILSAGRLRADAHPGRAPDPTTALTSGLPLPHARAKGQLETGPACPVMWRQISLDVQFSVIAASRSRCGLETRHRQRRRSRVTSRQALPLAFLTKPDLASTYL